MYAVTRWLLLSAWAACQAGGFRISKQRKRSSDVLDEVVENASWRASLPQGPPAAATAFQQQGGAAEAEVEKALELVQECEKLGLGENDALYQQARRCLDDARARRDASKPSGIRIRDVEAIHAAPSPWWSPPVFAAALVQLRVHRVLARFWAMPSGDFLGAFLAGVASTLAIGCFFRASGALFRSEHSTDAVTTMTTVPSGPLTHLPLPTTSLSQTVMHLESNFDKALSYKPRSSSDIGMSQEVSRKIHHVLEQPLQKRLANLHPDDPHFANSGSLEEQARLEVKARLEEAEEQSDSDLSDDRLPFESIR